MCDEIKGLPILLMYQKLRDMARLDNVLLIHFMLRQPKILS